MFKLFLFFWLFFFSACSTKRAPYIEPKHPPLLKHQPHSYKLHNKNHITTKLLLSYEKWQGVKYCYGGESNNGIDCSSLVQQIYKEAFHIKLPRTTKEQIKKGIKITKKELKEGDLLFFKTSYKELHTGIYLEKGNFIHASSKYGVSLANIHNPYWRSRYYQAKRLLY